MSSAPHAINSPVTTREDAAVRIRRQRQLIDATIDSISRHGLHGTTLARVAERAGLSPGIVNHYFQSKDALLLAALHRVAEDFEQQWREALASTREGPAARLRALVQTLFDPHAFDTRRVAVWSAFWGEAQSRVDYMAVCGDSDRAYYQQILGLCREIVRMGNYRGVDADAVGRALFALMDTLPEDCLVDRERFDAGNARDTCLKFLASVFPQDFHMPATTVEAAAAARDDAVNGAPVAALVETLPGWVYDNSEFMELEKEHLFRRQWLLVGHVNEVPAAGDYMTLDAVDERVAVVRAEDGRLHAFHNVCRHRASRVLAGERGHCERALTCPYHGWSYNFDGSLRGVPAADTFGQLDATRYSLPAVEIDEWMGFVFVRIHADSGPRMSEMMQPFDAEVAHYRPLELHPLVPQWTRTMDVNWKSIRDNDSEGYHVRIGHPGLQSLVGDSYEDQAHGNGVSRSFSRIRGQAAPQWSVRAYQNLLPEVSHLPEKYRRAWLYFGMFPNLSFGFYPDLIEYYQVFPVSPGRTLLRGGAFAVPDERREIRAARWLNKRINAKVFDEDDKFCLWTDAGIRSSSYPGGPLSDKEVALRQFHDRIRHLLPVARRQSPPAVGKVADVDMDMRASQ